MGYMNFCTGKMTNSSVQQQLRKPSTNSGAAEEVATIREATRLLNDLSVCTTFSDLKELCSLVKFSN